MIPDEKLDSILSHFEYLENRLATGDLADEFAAISKEYAQLKPVVDSIKTYRSYITDLASAHSLLDDPEMCELAQIEIEEINLALPKAEYALKIALLPSDENDDRSVMLEIRAGTGGDEAALFAADLLRMYQRFCERNQLSLSIIEAHATELGGYREIICSIKGDSVFAKLKHESGGHRVQRVPTTESGGRVHTSAATVAVLPEAEDVDIEIAPNDIRIDTMRASGAGGQHVNTTDSAVRITHIPSGIVVTSSEKSQHQNRAIAMQVLKTRLYDIKRQEIEAELASSRKGQVGSGDRSDRIRTYNFPQGRLTDHRINLTLYKLDQIMDGDLNEIIDALRADEQATQLAELNL